MKHGVAILAALLLLSGAPGLQAQSASTPLINAHAHNDYLHKRPLLDALDHGFCSVEADIFLVDGELLVAHTRKELVPERTLQKLYLDPLRERVKQNNGRVFRDGPEFWLFIDLKSSWTNTYPALRNVLTNYADMLTTFRGETKQANAVTVIITGSRDLKMFVNEAVRMACFDGTTNELGKASSQLVPTIGVDWKKNFTWTGNGAMSSEDEQKLRDIVTRAHKHGQRVRFWAIPDFPESWRTLRAAGVDLLNTDDLAGMEKFLRSDK